MLAEGRQVYSPPPSKLPRLSGTEPNDGVVTMAAPSPLVLGLGLGVGGSGSDSSGSDAEASAVTMREGRPSALTFMQRQELEHQVLIYRCFAAGSPVPVHLVLPIWKSVAAASSFGPQSFPSLTGLGSLCFDYRSSMEPEPGRCRRTDGKKWRCSRDVVPGHKYCERHVHRGRGRSRKPMEASVPVAPTSLPVRPALHTAASAPSPPRLGFSSDGASVLLAHTTARAT
ncbi:growth-regulating factor 12-like [Oryza brachyantha]|uniref:Growth-regulating factor n=1 Tax=Oryza brachyantha TaxID=4533 RepID=J3M0L4_ORYBR|nr:growth-regulating factor 12-like [Oryza brachyantha]